MTGPPLRKVTIDGALDLLSRRHDLEPTVIIGEEVETCFPGTWQWAHVNVLGVDEAIHEDLKRVKGDIYELVPYLRSRNPVHFLNHPLQSYRMQKKPMRFVEDVLELFTHVELGNGTLSVANSITHPATGAVRRRPRGRSHPPGNCVASQRSRPGGGAWARGSGRGRCCRIFRITAGWRLRRSIIKIPCHQDIPLPILDTAATLVRQAPGTPVDRRAEVPDQFIRGRGTRARPFGEITAA